MYHYKTSGCVEGSHYSIRNKQNAKTNEVYETRIKKLIPLAGNKQVWDLANLTKWAANQKATSLVQVLQLKSHFFHVCCLIIKSWLLQHDYMTAPTDNSQCRWRTVKWDLGQRRISTGEWIHVKRFRMLRHSEQAIDDKTQTGQDISHLSSGRD